MNVSYCENWWEVRTYKLSDLSDESKIGEKKKLKQSEFFFIVRSLIK